MAARTAGEAGDADGLSLFVVDPAGGVTLRLECDPVERARAKSATKVTVANACRFVGQNAVQLHGDMGIIDELAIGHYFLHATLLESENGSADWHLARHAALAAA